MITKRVITSIEKISSEVLDAIRKKYPDGWSHHVRRISKPNGEFFHGITIDMGDTSYLIRVNVKVDSKSDLEKEEEKEQDYYEEEARSERTDQEEPSEVPDY
jgi:hypothetical protein